MSRKFSVGDMALTVYPIPAVEAGTVVVLDRQLDAGAEFEIFGQTYKALQAGWLCSKPGLNSVLAYAETSLMPLKLDPAPEKVKAQAVPV